MHGLRALRDTLQSDKELNLLNCSVGVVGKGPADEDKFEKFEVVNDTRLQAWLDVLNQGESDAPAAAPAPGGMLYLFYSSFFCGWTTDLKFFNQYPIAMDTDSPTTAGATPAGAMETD